jgi:hypothetical protein
MKGFWLLVHVIGFVAWIGGGLAVMLSGITAKYFTRSASRCVPDHGCRDAESRRAGIGARGPERITQSVPYFQSSTVPTSLMAMQVSILGAVVAVGIVTPTAARLARLGLDPRGEFLRVSPH